MENMKLELPAGFEKLAEEIGGFITVSEKGTVSVCFKDGEQERRATGWFTPEQASAWNEQQ
jgi:hypothetical protein